MTKTQFPEAERHLAQVEKKRQTIRRIPLGILGIALIVYTVIFATRSNMSIFVLLPAIIGTPLVLYAVFAPRVDPWFRTKTGQIVKWILIFLYAGYALLVCIFAAQVAFFTAAPLPQKVDAIIVLGAGLRSSDAPSYTLQSRLDRAFEIAVQHPESTVVVSGGKSSNHKLTEAQSMANYLISHGMDPARILLENRASSTVENFQFSKELLDMKFGENRYFAVFVTNDFHVPRSSLVAQSVGLNSPGVASYTPLFTIPANYMRESLAMLSTIVFGPGAE